MIWLIAVVVVLLLAGIAFVAAGRGAPMAQEPPERAHPRIPVDGRLGPADLRAVRFPVVLRGYRMADVDALLDRLAAERDEPAGPASDGDSASEDPGVPGAGED